MEVWEETYGGMSDFWRRRNPGKSVENFYKDGPWNGEIWILVETVFCLSQSCLKYYLLPLFPLSIIQRILHQTYNFQTFGEGRRGRTAHEMAMEKTKEKSDKNTENYFSFRPFKGLLCNYSKVSFVFFWLWIIKSLFFFWIEKWVLFF